MERPATIFSRTQIYRAPHYPVTSRREVQMGEQLGLTRHQQCSQTAQSGREVLMTELLRLIRPCRSSSHARPLAAILTRNARLSMKLTRSWVSGRFSGILAAISVRRICSVGHPPVTEISLLPAHAISRSTAASRISLISIRIRAAISVIG